MPHVILFVDDEPEVLALLRRTFPADDGYEALTAPSGRVALDLLRSRRVDLLVTDQRMPGMSGIELVEAARRLDPELCAILLTAYTDPRDIVDAINRGQVWRYLVKPWEKADLRQTVVRALEQVELRRERARLQAEVERRLDALQAASEIAREVGAAESLGRILERVAERLPRIVRCDVAAAIVAAPEGATDLLIRPCVRLSDAALLEVKELAVAAFREHAGRPVAEADVRVRVSGAVDGDGAPVESFAARLTLPVEVAGACAGAVLVARAREEPFAEDDARVLDVLVNEVAQSLGAFAARLEAERQRLERVVECMADGLLYAATGKDEIVANPAARRMLGAPADARLDARWLKDALGFYPFDLVRGLDADPSGRAWITEEVRVAGRTLSSVVSPVIERGGRLAGVAVALRDVTEQKELAVRKEEFVQVVSHELRTPLASIAGALDLVLGGLAGGLGEKQVRYLRMARDSSEKLNAMVDELLDVARLAKGKLRMEPQVVFVDELARTVVDRYQAAAAERGQELAIEVPPEPVRIVADGGRLGQVLSNLLTNAIKFTPDNGNVRVRVFRAPAVPGMVGLSVWNAGEGIPDADLERIFEKFEQARTETTRRVRGTGLGLAICRGIVEAHGGAVWAESAPGAGATFVVVLPDQPPEGAGERPPIPPDAPAILVVDDPDGAAIACGVLRAHGLRSARAADVDGALALARQAPPRVVVWDPHSPPLEQVPLAEILHHDADTRCAALLAFTGSPREAAFRAGADEHLAKPAASAALAAAVEALSRRGRAVGVRVVVVDDDPAIRAICAEVLRCQGYEVDEAGSCSEGRRLVLERRPQVVLFDVQLPDGDGFGLLESLAEERAREPFAAVFLSARGETGDKVRGLRLGADDYLTKPFDAQELVARIDGVLRRRDAALHASPTTRLPGGRAIDLEVERRIEAQVAFALSYVDLDGLKAYNDTYGYAKADGVILQTAGLLRDAVARHGGDGAFLGHVGGDDFVILTAPERAARVGAEVVASFDRVIPLYYERADRERGAIDAVDRFGTLRSYPILSVSIATVHARPGRFARHADLARAAAELKDRAKRVKGSVHLEDAGEPPP